MAFRSSCFSIVLLIVSLIIHDLDREDVVGIITGNQAIELVDSSRR